MDENKKKNHYFGKKNRRTNTQKSDLQNKENKTVKGDAQSQAPGQQYPNRGSDNQGGKIRQNTQIVTSVPGNTPASRPPRQNQNQNPPKQHSYHNQQNRQTPGGTNDNITPPKQNSGNSNFNRNSRRRRNNRRPDEAVDTITDLRKSDSSADNPITDESIYSSEPFNTYNTESYTAADPMSEPELYSESPAADNQPVRPSKTRIPDFSAFDFEDKSAPAAETDKSGGTISIVGVRFKRAGKIYYFAPGEIIARRGDFAIVETARGPEYGEVWLANCDVPENDIIQPLRSVIRLATPEDTAHNEENQRREHEAFTICLEKIAKHGLDMKLVDVQYTFDNSKLLFYFTSAGRVDFRDLVKDLASVFRTRIELRQIGIRDEAKLLGGLGACGRSLCCSTFLSDFVQVSIKMAKEQSLSLNSNKISGACGRLMCCLRYEYDTYVDEIRCTPPVDSLVRTADGDGIVIEINPLAGTVKVRLNDKQDTPPKFYDRNDVKLLTRPAATDTLGVPKD